jgi:NitT/TauT family transport system permease protein
MTSTNTKATPSRRVAFARLAILTCLAAIWEVAAASGLLFRDVVPSLSKIGIALVALLSEPSFYSNLAVTAYEVAMALFIGGTAGIATGIALGASPYLSRAYEGFIYYLGPTPKIIFFPLTIMWFGVGPGSKIALGVMSSFFPIALSTAAAMREIDRVLIQVGRSFNASTWAMITKIYLPAIRTPVMNGLRLGLGVAIIGVLLAETKLSNQGLGFMIIQSYTLFNMPRMYALLIGTCEHGCRSACGIPICPALSPTTSSIFIICWMQ